jgi:hypothetical protein
VAGRSGLELKACIASRHHTVITGCEGAAVLLVQTYATDAVDIDIYVVLHVRVHSGFCAVRFCLLLTGSENVHKEVNHEVDVCPVNMYCYYLNE